MGQTRIPDRVKLITGLIFGDAKVAEEARGLLERRLRNTVDFESDAMDFAHTNYYTEEMGSSLKRKFLSFKRLVDLKDIYKVKLVTNAIEKRLSGHGRR